MSASLCAAVALHRCSPLFLWGIGHSSRAALLGIFGHETAAMRRSVWVGHLVCAEACFEQQASRFELTTYPLLPVVSRLPVTLRRTERRATSGYVSHSHESFGPTFIWELSSWLATPLELHWDYMLFQTALPRPSPNTNQSDQLSKVRSLFVRRESPSTLGPSRVPEQQLMGQSVHSCFWVSPKQTRQERRTKLRMISYTSVLW